MEESNCLISSLADRGSALQRRGPVLNKHNRRLREIVGLPPATKEQHAADNKTAGSLAERLILVVRRSVGCICTFVRSQEESWELSFNSLGVYCWPFPLSVPTQMMGPLGAFITLTGASVTGHKPGRRAGDKPVERAEGLRRAAVSPGCFMETILSAGKEVEPHGQVSWATSRSGGNCPPPLHGAWKRPHSYMELSERNLFTPPHDRGKSPSFIPLWWNMKS